jgi:hypothetical protein
LRGRDEERRNIESAGAAATFKRYFGARFASGDPLPKTNGRWENPSLQTSLT